MCRWFDRFLNDVDNGIDREPRLLAYLRDGVAAEPYPDVAPGRWRAFTLVAVGSTADRAAPGRRAAVVRLLPQRSPARTWNGPQWVGHAAPWWGAGGPPVGQSADMATDDHRSLCFDLGPLEQPLEILGEPVLELDVSADRPVALVAARLEHVHPDGFSALVCRGGLNLTHRDSHEQPTPLEPGAAVPGAGAAGVDRHGDPGRSHALRLALAGAHWPIMWPSPEPVTVTVHGGRLVLPAPDPHAEVAAPRAAGGDGAGGEPGAVAGRSRRGVDADARSQRAAQPRTASRTAGRRSGTAAGRTAPATPGA